MKRFFAVVVLALAAGACGGGDQASPSPTPTRTHEITGRIMGPAGDAQDTVDQLNQRTEDLEN
jgi:hypothetical protein